MRNAGRTVAIVQARMSSSRFPGKVIQPLCGMPMIVFMMKRVARAELVDEVCLATSDDPSDDGLAAIVEAAGFGVHRGSLNDVLDRFTGAARMTGAELVLRLTGDCPLADPALIDQVVAACLEADADYASNIAPPTFPDGLDVEVIRRDVLESAGREATLSSDREHVTPFIRRETSRFKHVTHCSIADLSALRWTVDYPDDFETVAAILAGVVGEPLLADFYDCLRSAQRLGGQGGLSSHIRNEGYQASLEADATINGGSD